MDIYAPEGSVILAVEDGIVLEVGIFTSPERIFYWKTTFYVLIKHGQGLVGKYAEMGDVLIQEGDAVKAGQVIGHVGVTLDKKKIGAKTPSYIQKLNRNNNQSMLHFELYRKKPIKTKNYLGGNTSKQKKPEGLVDPTEYLNSISRKRNTENPPARP